MLVLDIQNWLMGAKKQMLWSHFYLHYSGKGIKSYNLVLSTDNIA